MGKLASGLFLTLIVVGSSTGAHAGPWCAFYDLSTYNCGFHSYAQCYATSMGTGIAGRARRVRLPAIEGLRGLADCLALELGRKAARIAAPSKAVHLLRSSTET